MNTGVESRTWTQVYGSDELTGRRWSTYERKLRRLGLWQATGGPILDIACGMGEALTLLHEAGHTRLVGIDPIRPRQEVQPFLRIGGDGARLPFVSHSFQHVACLHSLHHFRDFDHIGAMLTEARRVMRPGGRLYLIDHFGSPYLWLILRLLELPCPLYPAVARHFGAQMREERDYIYWWLANWRSLFPALAQAGFQVTRFRRRLFFFYLVAKPDA